MNRRGFIGSLAGFAASLTLDPEKLLWRPEAKTIFLPTTSPLSYGWTLVKGPAYAHLDKEEMGMSILTPDEPIMIKIGDSIYMHTRMKGNVNKGDFLVWDDPKTVRLATSEELKDHSRVAGMSV